MTDNTSVKLFTDEHVHSGLASALRQRGYDAISCQEVNRVNQGISDEDQLAYATEYGRAMLTNTMVDFIRLDQTWKRNGQQHAGIVLYTRINTFGELLRRIGQHLAATDPHVQYDTLLWLA